MAADITKIEKLPPGTIGLDFTVSPTLGVAPLNVEFQSIITEPAEPIRKIAKTGITPDIRKVPKDV